MALNTLSYPRSVALFFFGVGWTLAASILAVVLGFTLRSKTVLDHLIRVWARVLLWPSGLKIEVRGGDRLRREGHGFLILFNHSSLIDIPILFSSFPRPFRFGAKIELFRIPFFGAAMRACGVLPIDRANRGKVMKIYQEAITRVQQGECFALAPEGTRQNAAELGPFKRGPFEFALNAQMQVVPVVVAGALAALPKDSIWINAGHWRRRVIVEIGEPVNATDFDFERLSQFQAEVRGQMAPTYTRLNQELGF